MKRDLIVFGEDWGGLPSSTQHLICRLSQDRKVVWVNSIGLRRPTFTLNDCKRAWHKLTASGQSSNGSPVDASHQSQKTTQPENLTVVNPSTLPAPRSTWGRKLAASMLRKQLVPIIEHAKLYNPIMWTSLPTAVDVSDQLGASSLVYYCGDDFSSLAGVDHNTVAQREKDLVQKADLILAASETLYTRFSNRHTKLLPHGVDYDLFSTPAQRAQDLPDNGKPTAGFYGSLSDWLDYDLLNQTILSMPEWNFVFIGKPCDAALSLKQHANVTLLGPKPHHELPGYSQHWSASLLPFVDNAQIRACNPLKLREYLAAGRPVISTPFPAVDEYRSYVSVVHTASEMAEALNTAANTKPNPQQQTAVSMHTWDARAKTLNAWLDVL
ncbi:glycosyltransferase [Enterovibrio calviensis]|uniref:glycosyltransferase n=1 Tax=Enterovibrio calviensis TaxID=91359 RepID=UPI00048845FB|nr:glycosyltransferase [Enterovibrio calviensis]